MKWIVVLALVLYGGDATWSNWHLKGCKYPSTSELSRIPENVENAKSLEGRNILAPDLSGCEYESDNWLREKFENFRSPK